MFQGMFGQIYGIVWPSTFNDSKSSAVFSKKTKADTVRVGDHRIIGFPMYNKRRREISG